MHIPRSFAVAALLCAHLASRGQLSAPADTIPIPTLTGTTLPASAPAAPSSYKIASVSPANAWIGATLAYNLQETSGVENVVGSSRVAIAPVERFDGTNFNLQVIGNIGRITSLTTDSVISTLNSLTQSTQGLSIGIAPMYTWRFGNTAEVNTAATAEAKKLAEDKQDALRAFFTLTYRANKYKVGPEDAQTDLTMNQARFTAGLEFEGLRVKDGRTFSFTAEVFGSFFDDGVYETVFGIPDTDQLIGAELTLIVPLGGVFGFLINGTYAQGDVPIYQTGLVVAIEGKDGE